MSRTPGQGDSTVNVSWQPWLHRFLGWVVAVMFLNGFYAAWLVELSPALFWTVDIATFCVVPLALLRQAIQQHETSLAALGFREQTDDKYGCIVLMILTVGAPLASLIVYGIGMRLAYVVVPGSQQLAPMPWGQVLPAGGIGAAIAILYLSLSAGVIEELAFRSILHQLLPARLAYSWRYVAISATMFSAVHWEQGLHAIIGAAVFGAFMAVLYRSGKNIWPCIVGHTALDLLLFSQILRHASQ